MRTGKKEAIQVNYYLGQTKEIKTKNGPDAMYSPKTTVVLLIDKTTGCWSRGVAVCNDTDKFCKKQGRAIAFQRAQRALVQKKSCPNNVMRHNRDSFLLPEAIYNKCSYMPELIAREKGIYHSVIENQIETSPLRVMAA